MKFTFGINQYSCNWLYKEKSNQLFFTRGLPRSGKGTFANKWIIEQEYSYKDILYNRSIHIYFPLRRIVVCADDFRLATYGQDYDHSCECVAAATIFTAIKALLKTHCVLFDDTNSSEWSLRRIFEICPTAEYINIGTEKKICLERNAKTKKIPEFVFDRIERQLVEIEPEQIKKDYI
jgi:hypothetical protein